MSKIQLGDRAKCAITGFEGVVVSRTEYINGCVRFGIQPTQLNKDGKTLEPEYIDEKQSELVEAAVIEIEKSNTGGPAAVPKQDRNPPQ